jgi:hypothetical protein
MGKRKVHGKENTVPGVGLWKTSTGTNEKAHPPLAGGCALLILPVHTDIPCPILALFYWRKGGKLNTI